MLSPPCAGGDQMNEASRVHPMSGCAPITMVWALPQPLSPAGLVAHVDHAVAVLVQAARHGGIGRVGDVLAGHLERPLPLPVVAALEAEVEAGPQVEPGV
jgi:hypothetical protein